MQNNTKLVQKSKITGPKNLPILKKRLVQSLHNSNPSIHNFFNAPLPPDKIQVKKTHI